MQGSEVGFGLIALGSVIGIIFGLVIIIGLAWRWANRALDDLEHWDDE